MYGYITSLPMQNSLEFIKFCVSGVNIIWTHHVNMRMGNRFISREGLLSSVKTYEIIETYKEKK